MRTAMTLNFVVTGNERCGASVLTSALRGTSGAFCHRGLLDRDEVARWKNHEAYFDMATSAYDPEHISPGQYLRHVVFDNPRHGERALGVFIPYARLVELDLFELLSEMYFEGDFCVINVVRHPLACLVSKRQAEASEIWGCPSNKELRRDVPGPAYIEIHEAEEAVRLHTLVQRRLKTSCGDRLNVLYSDLCYDTDVELRRVQNFLELPNDQPLIPGFQRLHNRPFHDRIVNFDELRRTVAADVRDFIDLRQLL